MRWIDLRKAGLLLVLATLTLAGCAEVVSPPSPPSASMQWQGQWVISNFTERGTLTHKYDGRVVRIVPRGNGYRLEGLTETVFWDDMYYAPRGATLLGQYIPDYDGMSERFGNIPDAIVRQAATSQTCVYKSTMTMTRDGVIRFTHNNLGVNHQGGRFAFCRDISDWLSFTLTRR